MRTIPPLLAAALFFAGCAAPNPGTSASAHLGAGEVAGLGAAAAAGAVLGDKLGGPGGALVGGAAGLATAAVVSNALSASPEAPAADEARREERLKIMQRYWYDHTASVAVGPGGGEAAIPAPPGDAALSYPAGVYDGIRFAPRSAAAAELAEPFR